MNPYISNIQQAIKKLENILPTLPPDIAGIVESYLDELRSALKQISEHNPHDEQYGNKP